MKEIVTCSWCLEDLKFLGGLPDNPAVHVASVNSSKGVLDQWHGNVCLNCGAVFCGNCLELGGPTPCRRCSRPTEPAQRYFLDRVHAISLVRKDRK